MFSSYKLSVTRSFNVYTLIRNAHTKQDDIGEIIAKFFGKPREKTYTYKKSESDMVKYDTEFAKMQKEQRPQYMNFNDGVNNVNKEETLDKFSTHTQTNR